MLEALAALIAGLSSLVFAYKRLPRLLRFFQQEEYNPGRFLVWVKTARAWDSRGSLVCAVTSFLLMLVGYVLPGCRLGAISFFISILGGLVLCWLAGREPDPRSTGKIRLKMTERASGIYRVSYDLYILLVLFSALAMFLVSGRVFPAWYWLLQLFFIQGIPFCLALAVVVLSPEEKAHQRKFIKEAKDRLREVSPVVIGITGSYGKTSTKAVLAKLLDAGCGATFSPRDGINTVMGNTRAIREGLASHHRFAVFEMGAYTKGSIAKLCELTPPQHAIITAVGIMHLGRFGGKDEVLQAKSELAAAIPDDGILVCNGDDEGARTIAKRHLARGRAEERILRYGFDDSHGDLACRMSDVRFSVQGSHFVLHWKGESFSGFTPLHGRPALLNCMAAFTMGCVLGAQPEYLIAVLRNLEPVKNRLQVERYPNGYVQINDAYNSNPVGFASALEVLRDLPGNRKVLVTPGMIDLGEEQAYENYLIGKKAAEICHLVMIVGVENREALRKGLEEGGLGVGQMRFFDDRESALLRLQVEHKDGHVVLIENDLPDLFETEEKF